ncbi:MAG: SU10 major capsid protein [Aestuariivirga sp.]
MAIIANTFQSTAAKANRESLADMISMITPKETKLYSGMGKGSASATFEEWTQRNLRAPAANVQLEGDAYTFNATTPTVRVGNYTQILRDSWIVSRTQNSVDNAGRGEKSTRAKMEAGLAIRKDVELSLLSPVASVAGASRVSAGLPSWLTTNVSRGATGANGGYQVGTKLVNAPTAGTKRAFTQALLDTVMQQVYNAGGNVSEIMVSPYNKSVFVTFMSNANVATFRHAVENGDSNRVVSNADWYDGPFGTVKVEPNRVMVTNATVASNILLLDYGMLSFDWLDPIKEDPKVTTNADADAGVLIGEGTLKVENEAGLGAVADVFGINATT